MGKRIIIQGVSYAANGIAEVYTEHTVTTEQGMVTPSTTAANFGKLGSTASGAYYNNYVHSNQSIVLHPGETLAIVERQSNTTRAAIMAYKSVDDSIYPALVCTSSYQSFGTLVDDFETSKFNDVRNSSYLPRVITNDSEIDWYIVVEVNNENDTITPTTNPAISYRIYS